MTVINHYGVHVDTEKNQTGVIGLNDLSDDQFDFIMDLMHNESTIDLDYENFYNRIMQDESLTDEEKETELEYYSSDPPTLLIGDWKKEEGIYNIDKIGSYGFTAIVREYVIQILYSTNIKNGVGLCSPCYPGQCDLTSMGDFKAYTIPQD